LQQGQLAIKVFILQVAGIVAIALGRGISIRSILLLAANRAD
jgi:hypothetical protein